MREDIQVLHNLLDEEQSDKALDKIDEIEKNTGTFPYLLVMKGVCIQLADPDKNDYELDDAKRAFETALEIEGDYISALIELGWFTSVIEGNANEAKKFFEQALSLAKSQLTEAVQSLAKCVDELEGKKNAIQLIDDVISSPMEMEKIAELKKYIEESAISYEDDTSL